MPEHKCVKCGWTDQSVIIYYVDLIRRRLCAECATNLSRDHDVLIPDDVTICQITD